MTIKRSVLFSIALTVAIALPLLLVQATHAASDQNFDTDPSWTRFNNPANDNDFGFQDSNLAGGTAGEAGGFFSITNVPVWYGDESVGEFGGDDALSASGILNILSVDETYNTNVLIGHFDQEGFDFGSQNGIGLQVLEDGPSTFRIFYLAGLVEGHLFTIDGLNLTRTWDYSYDPSAGSSGSLTVSLSGPGGETTTHFLTPGERGSIGSLDTFGLAVKPHDSVGEAQAEIYVDNLSYTSESGSTTGLVSHWPAEGNADDIVGSNNGTLHNGARFAPGKVGEAFKFDGVNDYVEVPDSPELRTLGYNLTVALWMNPRPQGGTPDVTVIRKGIGCNDPGWGLTFGDFSDGKAGLFFQAWDGEVRSWGAFSSDILAGNWHHIVATADGTDAKIYVDGELADQGPIDQTISIETLTPITIGANKGNCSEYHNFYKGLIDEIQIYNRALDDSEIQAIFGDTIPPRCEVIGVVDGDLHVEVEDTGDGLKRIRVLVADNATVDVPEFDVGTNDVVTVVGRKIDSTARASIMIEALDDSDAMNRSECDPVLVSLSSEEPTVPSHQTFSDIPGPDRYVTLYSEGPALSLVTVNGVWTTVLTSQRSIDIGPAFIDGRENTVTLWSLGVEGSVMFSDVIPSNAANHTTARGSAWDDVWAPY